MRGGAIAVLSASSLRCQLLIASCHPPWPGAFCLGRAGVVDRWGWLDYNEAVIGGAKITQFAQEENKMLTFYIQSALRTARYEILEDDTYYGEIPGFSGVYADADTLEACRDQLQEVLEGWILLGLRLGHELPEINGIKLEMVKEAA